MEQTQVTFSAFVREAEVSEWLAGMTFNDFLKLLLQVKDKKMARKKTSTNSVCWASLTYSEASQAGLRMWCDNPQHENHPSSTLKEAQTKMLFIGICFSNTVWSTDTATWLLAGSAKEAAILWNVRWILLWYLRLKFTFVTPSVLSDVWCLNFDNLQGGGRKKRQGTAYITSLAR